MPYSVDIAEQLGHNTKPLMKHGLVSRRSFSLALLLCLQAKLYTTPIALVADPLYTA